MQAKDISDGAILGAIGSLKRGPAGWAAKRDIYEALGEPPPKVFFAKLAKLDKRGLADGCALDWCGCTGWEVTPKGEELLAAYEEGVSE